MDCLVPGSQIPQSISPNRLQVRPNLPLRRADPARDLRLALLAQTQPLPHQSPINHPPAARVIALDGPEGTRVQATGVLEGIGELGLQSRQPTVRVLDDGRDQGQGPVL